MHAYKITDGCLSANIQMRVRKLFAKVRTSYSGRVTEVTIFNKGVKNVNHMSMASELSVVDPC